MENENKKINLKDFIKNNKGIAIAICVVLILIIVAIILLVLNNGKGKDVSIKKDSGITANTNSGIVKDEEFEGLSFTNVTLIKDGKTHQYTLTCDVTNNTEQDIATKQVDIVLKNEKGNEIITLLGYIGENGLKSKETTTITPSTSDAVNLSSAAIKEIKAHE